MAYWLVKTEPTSFNLEDLDRLPNKTTSWDGVRNYQARNMLRDQMKVGDEAFLYYSNCDEPRIVGIVEIVEEGYPDPTAFERKHHHYDPKSDPDNPRWFMVDVQLKRRLKRSVSLRELHQYASNELNGMPLLKKGNRLSVTPVSAAHWKFIHSLEGAKQSAEPVTKAAKPRTTSRRMSRLRIDKTTSR